MATICAIRSATGGIPKVCVPPLSFGISTVRTGAVEASTPGSPDPSFFGYMPGDAPDPLTNVAVYSGHPWPYDWTASDWTTENLPVGFLVEGTPVPLPGAVWLLGSGLMGLGALGWRRRQKT